MFEFARSYFLFPLPIPSSKSSSKLQRGKKSTFHFPTWLVLEFFVVSPLNFLQDLQLFSCFCDFHRKHVHILFASFHSHLPGCWPMQKFVALLPVDLTRQSKNFYLICNPIL